MKAVFFVKKEKQLAAKNCLEGDDIASRMSISFRDNASLAMKDEGYYIELDGSDSQIARAKELLKEMGVKELKGKDLDKVLLAIKEQEDKADSGFGAIFG